MCLFFFRLWLMSLELVELLCDYGLDNLLTTFFQNFVNYALCYSKSDYSVLISRVLNILVNFLLDLFYMNSFLILNHFYFNYFYYSITKLLVMFVCLQLFNLTILIYLLSLSLSFKHWSKFCKVFLDFVLKMLKDPLIMVYINLFEITCEYPFHNYLQLL